MSSRNNNNNYNHHGNHNDAKPHSSPQQQQAGGNGGPNHSNHYFPEEENPALATAFVPNPKVVASCLRKSHGFPQGLVHCLFQLDHNNNNNNNINNATTISNMPAQRIWILDNSGSMAIGDGYRIVETSDGQIQGQVVTRWEELQQTATQQAELAAALRLPTQFRLLNHPGDRIGTQEFSLGTNTNRMMRGNPVVVEPPLQHPSRSSTRTSRSHYHSSPSAPQPRPEQHPHQQQQQQQRSHYQPKAYARQPPTSSSSSSSQRTNSYANTDVSQLMNPPVMSNWSSASSMGSNSSSTSSLLDALGTEELRIARSILQRTKPQGVTPLKEHIEAVERTLRSCPQHHHWPPQASGQPPPQPPPQPPHVVLVICTDGLPTDANGQESPEIQQDFVQALRRLQDLPIWLVIRLCTSERKVAQFYNQLDAVLELPLEVLDDHLSEAKEVGQHNPWLNYAVPLHRCRELGFQHRVLDLLDERPLTYDELREFCIILFGTNTDTIHNDCNNHKNDNGLGDYQDTDDDGLAVAAGEGWPDPATQWTDFVQCLQQHLQREHEQTPLHWDPRRKVVAPWINLKVLQQNYGGGRRGAQQQQSKKMMMMMMLRSSPRTGALRKQAPTPSPTNSTTAIRNQPVSWSQQPPSPHEQQPLSPTQSSSMSSDSTNHKQYHNPLRPARCVLGAFWGLGLHHRGGGGDGDDDDEGKDGTRE
ncbi:hypothetical protein ACA910_002216 [Epithemia clementina (nom. ined.)]